MSDHADCPCGEMLGVLLSQNLADGSEQLVRFADVLKLPNSLPVGMECCTKTQQLPTAVPTSDQQPAACLHKERCL